MSEAFEVAERLGNEFAAMGFILSPQTQELNYTLRQIADFATIDPLEKETIEAENKKGEKITIEVKEGECYISLGVVEDENGLREKCFKFNPALLSVQTIMQRLKNYKDELETVRGLRAVESDIEKMLLMKLKSAAGRRNKDELDRLDKIIEQEELLKQKDQQIAKMEQELQKVRKKNVKK